MISWIKGVCRERNTKGVVVETAGIGLFIETPITVLKNFAGNREEIELWLHMAVSEDSIRLFGFQDRINRELFQLLISLNGIGPKVALAIISTLSIQSLARAVGNQLPEVLESVPGIGRRTAERLIVELKSRKFDELTAAINQIHHDSALPNDQSTAGGHLKTDEGSNGGLEDLRSALENLGFKERDYNRVVTNLGNNAVKMEFADLVRHSLQILAPSNL